MNEEIETFDAPSDSYAEYCRKIVEEFDLSSVGDTVVGFDEVFCDYTDGERVVGIE